MIHNKEIYRKSQKVLNYLSFIRNESKDASFQIDNDLRDILDYVERLERDNLGLHEYKKHQEEKEAKMYDRIATNEPWTRGSHINKKRR